MSAWYHAARARGEAHIKAGGVSRHVTLVAGDDGVNDAVDRSYREKYARYASDVPPMLAEPAQGTTLRLVPRGKRR